MGKRPASVTALSIIGIVLASLYTIGLLISIYVLGFAHRDPMQNELMKDPIIATQTYAAPVINLVGITLLWIGSIASLNLKPIGRTCMLLYAYVMGAFTLINMVVSMAYIGPKTLDILHRAVHTKGGVMPPGFEVGFYGGMVCFGVVLMTYIIFILVMFNKPKVTNAFKGVFEAYGGAYPVQYWDQQQPPQFQ